MTAQVLIYRSDWLHPTEGFVSEHAEQLTRHTAITMGLRRPLKTCTHRPPDLWACGTGEPGRLERYGFRTLGKDRLPASLRPDLIHAHFATDALDMLSLADRWDVPLAVTLHGYDVRLAESPPPKGDGLHWRWKRKRLFERATSFLAVSQYLADRAVAAGFPARKMVVHNLGTPLPVSQSLPFAARSGIIFVGRLTRQKGISELLEALLQLKARGPVPRLDIYGDGPLRAMCEAAAEHLPLRFHGMVDPQQVRDAMARSRLLVLPSTEESFGLVAIEAEARGTPVVAYADGGLKEAVLDQLTGHLVDRGDISALAAAISEIYADPKRWGPLSLGAEVHVYQKFDQRLRAEFLAKFYDESIAA
jgi:glycosyltransferase involved in cell wall biosynthesis